MKLSHPVVIIFLHPFIVGFAALCVAVFGGSFSTESFTALYGIFSLFAAAIGFLICIGFAFIKERRPLIPWFLIGTAVVLLTGLFALSQIEFSR
jgi:hypothetical protein